MRRTGVTQATRGARSTHTVQHPHCPCGLQPSFTERQPSSSRSASRREIPSATETAAPLRVKETAVAAGMRPVLFRGPTGLVGLGSAEGGAAAAGTGRVGVGDVEAGALQPVAEV